MDSYRKFLGSRPVPPEPTIYVGSQHITFGYDMSVITNGRYYQQAVRLADGIEIDGLTDTDTIDVAVPAQWRSEYIKTTPTGGKVILYSMSTAPPNPLTVVLTYNKGKENQLISRLQIQWLQIKRDVQFYSDSLLANPISEVNFEQMPVGSAIKIYYNAVDTDAPPPDMNNYGETNFSWTLAVEKAQYTLTLRREKANAFNRVCTFNSNAWWNPPMFTVKGAQL